MYPSVYSEDRTLDLVLAGMSLSRYGDGEFKMCHGASIKSQEHVRGLQNRLCEVLCSANKNLLVGIPNIHSDTPKVAHWQKYTRYASILDSTKQYGSSFVTRPDSAPWINRDDYWAKLESLWIGQDVTLVRGSGKSLVSDDLIGAGVVTEIVAPRQHAFAQYMEIIERVGRPARALICLGPTATVLAADLCARGVQAIDLGHVGLFLHKKRKGLSMWVTKEDKEQPA